jgi:phosphomethylpyrimidine synthase
MTLIEKAEKKIKDKQIEQIARLEDIDLDTLRQRIALGKIVICSNPKHNPSRPLAVGKGLRTKVNVNLGTSPDFISLKDELEKLKISLKYKADAVMDLSTAGDLKKIRRTIIENSPISIGTVPIYETAASFIKRGKLLQDMRPEDIFETVKDQAEDGVDFMTLHCGLTLEGIKRLKAQGRLMDIVSRGGAMLASWMLKNKKENPLYEYYDDLLKILYKYDITISLGDGLRPGCIDDATDRAQIQELILLGELAKKANERKVQAMIEGPGHVPINQIKMNVDLQKKISNEAPFYVLGPLVTDAALGYDHIAGCIGSALAASYGADFICYLTPAEHLGLPTKEDVKDGLIASRIAAHAADVAKGVKQARELDRLISEARKRRDFKKQIELALEKEKPGKIYQALKSKKKDVCSMCSEYCAIKIIEEAFGK